MCILLFAKFKGSIKKTGIVKKKKISVQNVAFVNALCHISRSSD